MNTTMMRRTGLAAMALTMSLGLAACGSSDSKSGSAMKSTTTSAPASGSGNEMAGTFGPGCSAIPSSGKGSLNGMATDPVATAASNNPLLSTLVTAVTKAGLVDTLNSAKAITVFAPTNDAFSKIPKAQLDKLLANKAELTKVLTHHVVSGKLAADDLSGEHKTLAGDSLMVTGSGEDFTVGGAKVLCGNIDTANAKVYIIDSVLMP